ncbi:MAG: hypothetical protein A3J76_00100 [Candidatus Moranbacteria bacterium RBG_13_45_13]|nr:MAG: hypothetical protein A3J76_00100 [Candidatus Moranbacteria bacterium RBG_13_45_13]
MFWKFLDGLNFIARCRKYNLGLWQCPNFLFLMMGILTTAAMFATYFISRSFDNETVTIVSVSFVAGLIITISSFIIRGVEKVAEANILKSEFISVISHQLSGPLSAIKWNLEVIEKEKNPEECLAEKQFTFLENVKKANEKMLMLVSSLLEVLRVDQGRAVFSNENTDLGKILETVLNELKSLAEVKKIEVIVKADSQLPPVFVDPKKMKLVFHNLVGNAIMYSHEKSKVEICLKPEGGKILFSVQDWGVGIPKYQHDKIFEKFFRVSSAVKYRTEGVGLGLYLARSIVKAFGGDVWFESEVGKGSTFYVSLPTAK